MEEAPVKGEGIKGRRLIMVTVGVGREVIWTVVRRQEGQWEPHPY